MARGKDVLDAIDRSVSLRSKSLLSAWMRENHDAFRERLEAHFPDWKVLTDLFAEAGLTDRYGNKPKPESARKLWQRIKRETKLERSKPKQPAKSPTQAQAAQQPVQPNPTAPQTTESILAMLSTGRKVPDPIER